MITWAINQFTTPNGLTRAEALQLLAAHLTKELGRYVDTSELSDDSLHEDVYISLLRGRLGFLITLDDKSLAKQNELIASDIARVNIKGSQTTY